MVLSATLCRFERRQRGSGQAVNQAFPLPLLLLLRVWFLKKIFHKELQFLIGVF